MGERHKEMVVLPYQILAVPLPKFPYLARIILTLTSDSLKGD
jgi:hypothetical protein